MYIFYFTAYDQTDKPAMILLQNIYCDQGVILKKKHSFRIVIFPCIVAAAMIGVTIVVVITCKSKY